MKRFFFAWGALWMTSAYLLAAPPKVAVPITTRTPPGFHTLAIGDTAPDFSLRGVDGNTYSLANFRESPYLMVIFLCTHCPVSHAAETRLLPFAKEMEGKGLSIVAINPNNDDGLQIDELGYTKYGETYEGTKGYTKEHQIPFPFLYDGDAQNTAKAYGCLCTPHIFVFDRERQLRYAGRFDDSEFPDAGTVHSTDAANAVAALLAGKPVPVAQTKPMGCSTKWGMLKGVVDDFNEAWLKLPVAVESIDAAGVTALVRNSTKKVRVINVWATWCVPCIEEFPSLVTLARRLERRDFELITISLDDLKAAPKVKQFLEKQHAATPPMDKPSVDKEGRKTNNYHYTGGSSASLGKVLDPNWPGPLPYTVVIAPGSEVLSRWSGPVDVAALQVQLIDYLGGFHHPKKVASIE